MKKIVLVLAVVSMGLQGCNSDLSPQQLLPAGSSSKSSHEHGSRHGKHRPTPLPSGAVDSIQASPLLANLPEGSSIQFTKPLDLPFTHGLTPDEAKVGMDTAYIPGDAILFADGAAYTSADLANMDSQQRDALLANNCVIDFYDDWVKGGDASQPDIQDRTLEGSFSSDSSQKPVVQTSAGEITGPNGLVESNQFDASETVNVLIQSNPAVDNIVCTKSLKSVTDYQIPQADVTIADLQRHLGSGAAISGPPPAASTVPN